MKRLFTLFVVGLLFGLVGCDATKLSTTASTTTTETPAFAEYTGYASGLEITETVMPTSVQFPDLSFRAHFENVKVMPVAMSVCVTASISDSGYRGATYYLVGRYRGDTREESRRVFTSTSMNKTYGACFTGVNLSRPYEILLAKNDSDVAQAPSALVSVVTLNLHDPRAEQRGVVYGGDASVEDVGFIASDVAPSIRYLCAFQDSKRVIESMTFILIDRLTDTIAQTQTVAIDEAMYQDDMLVLPAILFSNLAPGIEYDIRTSFSGNDGIDAFENITATTFHAMSSTYAGLEIVEARHGLYAVVTALETDGEDVLVHVNVVDETTQSHAFVAEVHTSDAAQNDHVTTFDLAEGENSFRVSAASFSFGGVIVIRDTSTNRVVSRRVIDVLFNNYVVHYVYGQNGVLTVEIVGEEYNETETCRLELYSAGGTLLVTINLQTYRPGFVYQVTSSIHYQNYPGIYGKVVYQVETEIGLITHETIVTLVSW